MLARHAPAGRRSLLVLFCVIVLSARATLATLVAPLGDGCAGVCAYEQCFSTSDLLPTTVWSPGTTSGTRMTMSEGAVYAYNSDAGYFATDGSEGYEAADVPSSGYQARDVEGAISDRDWSTGYGSQVQQAMATMQEVDDFWRNEVGIQGIDGNNGLYRLVVLDERLDGGARCLSAKRNGRIYSYTILLGLAPDGRTIGAYPEILCHEYTHGVLSNLVQYRPGNGEHGALNEAMADIFGIAYLKDPSWHLAAGLEGYGYDKDIKHESRTMDDYDYESAFSLPGSTLVTKFLLGVLGKTDGAALDVHGNSYIVSHAVYEIWDGPYDGDFSKLTATMGTLLPVLPADADFADFRATFTAAARFLYGDDMARKVDRRFVQAGIPESKTTVVINASRTYVSDGNRIDVADTYDAADAYEVAYEPVVTPSARQTSVEDYRPVLSGNDTYYALLDLDGDGSDELLTAPSTSDGFEADSISVYTMRDGIPTCVVGWLNSTFDYVKHDAASGSLLATWGGAGCLQWITFRLEGPHARLEYLTQDLGHDTYAREVYDEHFSLVSSESLGGDEFGQALAQWDERSSRATYVRFSAL